eukprot:864962-Pleurochrysis_carterae.AAC.1
MSVRVRRTPAEAAVDGWTGRRVRGEERAVSHWLDLRPGPEVVPPQASRPVVQEAARDMRTRRNRRRKSLRCEECLAPKRDMRRD